MKLAIRSFVLCAAMALALGAGSSVEAASAPATKARCGDACLSSLVGQYLSAMVAHAPSKLAWAAHPRFSENDVMLKVGDGLWQTASGVESEKGVTVTDPRGQAAAYFGIVEEHGNPAYFGLRIKLTGGRIAEAETVVHRMVVIASGAPGGGGSSSGPGIDPKRYQAEPMFTQTLSPGERSPRARMIKLADGYFSTIQLNDGHVFTTFDPSCQRAENGSITAGPPTPEAPKSLGCDAQARLGMFRRITRARDRDFVVVDEARGVVVARIFLDHEGILTQYKLTDGTTMNAGHVAPQTWYALEMFKIADGKLTRIAAILEGMPYNMPSAWRRVAP
jgi:hypothetical protein